MLINWLLIKKLSVVEVRSSNQVHDYSAIKIVQQYQQNLVDEDIVVLF